jgi:hemerythrin-like domain-containing protein
MDLNQVMQLWLSKMTAQKMQDDKNAKLILDAANRYNKAVERESPVEQAEALNGFKSALSQFVTEVVKDIKKSSDAKGKSSYKPGYSIK